MTLTFLLFDVAFSLLNLWIGIHAGMRFNLWVSGWCGFGAVMQAMFLFT